MSVRTCKGKLKSKWLLNTKERFALLEMAIEVDEKEKQKQKASDYAESEATN